MTKYKIISLYNYKTFVKVLLFLFDIKNKLLFFKLTFRKVFKETMTSPQCVGWLSNWKCGFLKHDVQKDNSSCGVHVIEVKK